MIAAHPFSKKHVKINGIITVGNIPLVNKIVAVEVITATMKPINNELGPYPNNTGQSNAGIAPGTNFSAIPLNAGTISAINIRTPCNITVTPTPKYTECVNK